MSAAAISLTPSSFVQGGLLADVDVFFKTVDYRGFDYNGNLDHEVLAVHADVVILDEHGNAPAGADTVALDWTCGPKLDEVVISQDGGKLIPSTDPGMKTALVRNSNFHLLLQSLWGKGMPEEYLADGNVLKLAGLKAHLVRAAAPKRAGLSTKEDSAVTVVSNILAGPWDAVKGGGRKPATAAGKKTGTGTAAAAPAPAAQAAPAAATSQEAPESDNATLAANTLTEALMGAENTTLTIKDAAVLVFRTLTEAKVALTVRNDITRLIKNPAWLSANGFASDGDTVSMA